MKQFWLQVVLLLVVIFGGLILTRNQTVLNNLLGGTGSLNSTVDPQTNRLQIISSESSSSVKAEIDVEIADTKETRAKGLSGRTSLGVDSGMLFFLENRGIPNFWMKDMKIPLDFIWIDGDKVVDLLPNVRPPEVGQSDDTLPKYAPVVAIDKVLEVNAGYISKFRIKVGDRIQFVQSAAEAVPTYQ